MRMLLKTSIVISKWVDCEAELKRMKTAKSRRVEEIEQKLPALYINCLELISSIYELGIDKTGRFSMFSALCSPVD